eukprot:11711915-Alexandrium_andersonii.AAC.1
MCIRDRLYTSPTTSESSRDPDDSRTMPPNAFHEAPEDRFGAELFIGCSLDSPGSERCVGNLARGL